MSSAVTTTRPAAALNGLDTQKMIKTVGALKANPTLARFEFRARNRWIAGGENRTTIKDFYGAGAEDVSRAEPFEFTNGEPPVLLGNNEGANPVEFLLHALAGCVTTTTVLHASARGIEIESLSTRLVGDLRSPGTAGARRRSRRLSGYPDRDGHQGEKRHRRAAGRFAAVRPGGPSSRPSLDLSLLRRRRVIVSGDGIVSSRWAG